MKGKACDWYDNRARQLRSNRKIDTWSAFIFAMDERFMTSHEGNLAYAEMHRITYQGSFMTYVDKLIGLNEKANMSGRAWRTVLVNGLPHELRKDLAKLRGGKPNVDDALLAAIKEVGLAAEEFSRDEKLKDKGPGATPSGKGKGNGKHKRESEMASASGSLRWQTQPRRRTPLFLESKPRRHPPLDLNLGNQDIPKTRRMRRGRVFLTICARPEERRSSAPVADSITMAGNSAGEKSLCHLRARLKRRERVKRRRIRRTLRRHLLLARLRSREKRQPIM